IPPGRVRSRFENCPELLLRVFDSQSSQSFPDGRGVMTKIVEDRDTAGYSAHLHPPFNALESVEGGLNLLIFQSAMFGAGDYRQGVAHVQFTYQINVKLEAGDLELGRGRTIANVERLERIILSQP